MDLLTVILFNLSVYWLDTWLNVLFTRLKTVFEKDTSRDKKHEPSWLSKLTGVFRLLILLNGSENLGSDFINSKKRQNSFVVFIKIIQKIPVIFFGSSNKQQTNVIQRKLPI